MKIALFTDTFLPQVNGVTNTVLKMIDYFQSKNIEYKVFAPKYDDLAIPDSVEQFYSIKFFLYPDCRLAFPNFFRINKAFEEFQPDLVHNMTEFGMGKAGLFHAKRFGIPSISTYTTNFSKYLKYYNWEIIEDFADRYISGFHNKNFLTLCATAGTEKLLRSIGVSRIARFSRGVDTDLFSPAKRSMEFRKAHGLEDKVVFSYVGRIAAEKSLDILIDAYCRLHDIYGKKTALIMTGDGPCLDLCREKLPHDTVYTGFLTGEDLAVAYASADVFVCPSSTETFGNVVQEAMASGLAVLGADAGGVGENIRHGKTGLSFESGNADALYSDMVSLLLDENMRKALAAEGRAYALTRSWDSVFNELVEHYRFAMEQAEIKLPA
ncbi:MAG: glycosyltransferase family 1 protein [Ruminococcaceae bacterium]|nr:glycosyltransferase family 1 protein [Oscillospiraceae bacterium]